MSGIQRYRVEYAAKRYAAEIMRKFPSVQASAIPYEFGFAVQVVKNGGKSMAGKRPRNYGANAQAAAMAGNYRVPAI